MEHNMINYFYINVHINYNIIIYMMMEMTIFYDDDNNDIYK